MGDDGRRRRPAWATTRKVVGLLVVVPGAKVTPPYVTSVHDVVPYVYVDDGDGRAGGQQ